jgi:hypothetical protein
VLWALLLLAATEQQQQQQGVMVSLLPHVTATGQQHQLQLATWQMTQSLLFTAAAMGQMQMMLRLLPQ